MIGSSVARSPLMDFEDGLEPLAALMALAEGDPRPAKRRLVDHYSYAGLAAGQATIPGHGASHSLAADQYGRAAALADSLPKYNDDQREGIREKQAYELHEAKRYEEAMAVNRDVLTRGERLFGVRDSKLRIVLINLAQNLHGLGRKAEAEPDLRPGPGDCRGRRWPADSAGQALPAQRAELRARPLERGPRADARADRAPAGGGRD